MKKTLVSCCVAMAATALLMACSSRETHTETQPKWPDLQSPIVYTDEEQQFVADVLSRMSVEQKVGQILQAEIQTITPQEAKQYHIGSILNGGGSVPHRQDGATAKDWATFAQAFYEATASSESGVAIPVIWGTDAVHGHGNLQGATIFPHNIGLGAANNPDLMEKIGEITAREVRASGIDWVFAPTVAVARNDRWGRTYESYSEVPVRVAALAAPLVEGMQGKIGSAEFLDDTHVMASVKHFIADGGTQGGDDQGNAVMSEADLIRFHAPGYFASLDAGAMTVMSSFSAWNGDKMHGNKYLLDEVLRHHLNFNGFLVGDWNGHGQLPGCTNDSCPASFNAGLDMYMVPYDWRSMYDKVLEQVNAGDISLARLDQAVTRILLVKKRMGMFEGKGPLDRALGGKNEVVGSDAHRQVARQAVRESLVLLKNNQQVLPIAANARILVTGDGADNLAKQSGGWTVTWQGTGTQTDDYTGATSIAGGLRAAVTSAGGTVEVSQNGEFSAQPDVAIVVFGEDPYAEGQGDINTLEYSTGNTVTLALMERLKAQNIPVVAVFLSGRPLWVTPYINAADAFVAAWLPGSEGAGIADVLIGDITGEARYDFRGRLAFSWPATPLQDALNWGDDDYSPLFPYNYGLDYSSNTNLPQLNEDVEGLLDPSQQALSLYSGRPLQPFNVFINNAERNQILSGAFAQLPDGSVTLETTDKDVQEDALKLSFKDSWLSGVYIAGGTIDFTPYMSHGVLSMDLRIDSMKKGTLTVLTDCSINCRQGVNLRDWAIEQEGKGWQSIAIPLSCLVENQSDPSKIQRAFTLRTGGEGQLAVANVSIANNVQATVSCPANLSVTPATLNEYWSESWWLPRHKKKVTQAQQGTAELVMIGDSITHGWESDGQAVWEKHFGDIDTLNLGFGGDRTENVLWRLDHGTLGKVTPKLTVMMIGTNNTGHRLDTPEAIRDGVAAILDRLEQQIPESPVLLLGIFPRSASPDDALRKNNNAANVLLKALAEEKGIMYADIGDGFLDSSGTLSEEIMPDLLHPKAKGYEIWAKALTPYINKYVRQ